MTATGYVNTLIIEDLTFEEFVLSMLSAYTAKQHSIKEINLTDLEKETEHNKVEIIEEKKLLSKFENITDSELEKLLEKEYLEKLEYYNKRKSEKEEGEKKLQFILNKIENWIPPSDKHTHFKNNMITQIKETTFYLEEKPKKEDKKSYKERKINDAKIMIKYHSEEIERKEKVIKQNNAWLVQVYESLGLEVPEK